MKRLLFTAGGSPGQEGIYRYLEKKYDLYFVDMNVSNISPTIPDSKKFQIPAVTSELYIPTIIRCCEEMSIDLLVPGVDEELMQLHMASDKFENTTLFLPKPDFVETMSSKLDMVLALARKGIAVPKTVLADDGDISCVDEPYIVKPVHGRGSRNVFALDKAHQVASLYEAMRGKADSWIVQEKIIGEEYTVQVIAGPDSEIIAILPIKILEKRGSTVSATMVDDRSVIQYCRGIHDAFQPNGSYNIQLVKKSSGEVLAFEINPRISTTMVMAIAAGIDPFGPFLKKGEPTSSPLRVPKVHLHRHWVNVITVEN